MKIRNFSIIAHIDHGKSTLADRILEFTNTISQRDMQEQLLDQMDLERERGITIKMQPVQIKYKDYVLNLIDTPGHTDFSYEVSRALKAVEGAVLLVDSTQGVEAQTFSVLQEAKDAGLIIIPALSKIDFAHSRPEEISKEMIELLECKQEDIIKTSGKTGEGVENLLDEVIKRIPEPKIEDGNKTKGLVFDFSYSPHTGVIAHTRMFSGAIKNNEQCLFLGINKKIQTKEVGYFKPNMQKSEELSCGSIGYIVTGVKEPGFAIVGDTVVSNNDKAEPMEGYKKLEPVVWASMFPQEGDEFNNLFRALKELHLRDASLSFEEERSAVLGKGFRCGFLGMLHLEIITEQIKRDFDTEIIVTSPSTDYEITKKDNKKVFVSNPSLLPDKHDYLQIREPWVSLEIITPETKLGNVVQSLNSHEGFMLKTEQFSYNRLLVKAEMPLREMMRGFFDNLKNNTSGYASFSYKKAGYKEAQIRRLDVLIGEEPFPAFAKIVSKNNMMGEARKLADSIFKHLPKQMFQIKIQVKSEGKIIASKTISAMKKDVTAKLYGGDITRKMKLKEKQKKGKKKMKNTGSVKVPQSVFLKVMKGGNS